MNGIFLIIVLYYWVLHHLNRYVKIEIFLFCFFLISCATDKDENEQSSQFSELSFGTENTIEVMTWNLETFPKADDITVDYVAQIVTKLSCDVNAFQEINSGSYFTALINRCNELDSENNWEGLKSPSGSYGLGYIYKSNQINIETVYEIYDSENLPFPREPFILECEINNIPFVFINNHLKCCGDEEIDSIDINLDGIPDIPDEDDNEARRQTASFLLEEYISDYFTNVNVILLGDLNDDIHEPKRSNVFWNFIENSDQFQFVDMELAIDGDNGHHWTYWSYPSWPSHIDHILINVNLFDEFEHNASTVITFQLEDYFHNGWTDYDEFISDHRPVAWKFSL